MADEQQFSAQFMKQLREKPELKPPQKSKAKEPQPRRPQMYDGSAMASDSDNSLLQTDTMRAALFVGTPSLVDELTKLTEPLPTGRKIGKRSDPEYKRVMVLVRKDTEKTAARKWEDEQPSEDFSDLVEGLLRAYNAGKISV